MSLVGKLASVKPTDEEKAEAKKFIATAKAKASKMGSMVYWLKCEKQAGDDEADVALSSRGEIRSQYLEAYLVHMLRQKAGKVTVTKVAENLNEEFTDTVPMSLEIMDRELGADKAEHWRSSGQLKFQADSVTGSTDPKFVEWLVPKTWLRKVDRDGLKHHVANEAEADADTGAECDHTADVAEVKVEQLSPEEQEKRQIEDLKSSAKIHLRRFQDYLTEAKEIETRCGTNRYAATLLEDAKGQVTRLTKLVKLLDQLVTKTNFPEKELPNMLVSIGKLAGGQKEIVSWAGKLGVVTKAKRTAAGTKK